MKSVLEFQKAKLNRKKITMVTCYDYSMAKILNATDVDTLLVGDSVAQVMHGYETTLHATVGLMALHTKAVAKGAPEKFIIADMPFLSTRKGIKYAVEAAQKLMLSGANAVKIEGASGHLELIRHLVDSGIPVMGHLGLTPQSIHQLGGPKIQGRTESQAEKLLKDSLALEKAGCFAIVFELIPAILAQNISEQLIIPTIGIGAGKNTDGQVLVLQDLLGFNPDFNPKFLKKYSDGFNLIKSSVNTYTAEVINHNFPQIENSYE